MNCPECKRRPPASASNEYWPFCNAQHRTQFAQRVSRAAEDKRRRQGRLAPCDAREAGYSRRKKRVAT